MSARDSRTPLARLLDSLGAGRDPRGALRRLAALCGLEDEQHPRPRSAPATSDEPDEPDGSSDDE